MPASRALAANANSVAKMAQAKKMAAHPGPGKNSIAMPAIRMGTAITTTSGFRTKVGMRRHNRLKSGMLVVWHAPND